MSLGSAPMASYDAIARPAARDRGVLVRGAGIQPRRVRTADHGDQAARRRRGGDRRRRHLRRGRPRRPAEPRPARGARPLRHASTSSRSSSTGSTSSRRRAPEREDVSRDYRRWAFESAALDLALRQAGTNLAAALGREPQPLNFVNSMRLAGFDAEREVRRSSRCCERLEIYPTLRFKLDPFNDWDDELIAALVETGAVDSLDLKGFYKGTPVDVDHRPRALREADRGLPRRLARGPRRDRGDQAAPRPGLRAGHLGRADPLDRRHRGDALVAAEDGQRQALALRPDLQPLRRLRLLRGARASAPTAAARPSSAPAAARSSTWPRSSTPTRPNDVAPRRLQRPGQATKPGLPSSPLEPAIDALGFRWTPDAGSRSDLAGFGYGNRS